MNNIKDLQKKIHETAKSKGWWDEPRSMGDLLCLVHAELSEALEEIRWGRDPQEVRIEDGKPEGFPVEIADAAIRLLDICEFCNIDLQTEIERKMEYNLTR